MRVRLVWVGRTRNEHVRALVADYLERLARFTRCEVTEVRESAAATDRAILAEEGRRLAAALKPDAFVVLLDVAGEQWSSPELAAALGRWEVRGLKEVAFVVGGHLGVSAEVKARADVRWSLARLTLTHELARVLLVEQLYRAYTIARGLPYQK
ncbi:MAG TPA: 23S rRNA (pseudouridine(1915)-N(3))-methyltransferase RlmH [Pyrinomonadaceae bacterium]|jgi:23S rRNA (pseudouridine1915-N3)-methyltransferase